MASLCALCNDEALHFALLAGELLQAIKLSTIASIATPWFAAQCIKLAWDAQDKRMCARCDGIGGKKLS